MSRVDRMFAADLRRATAATAELSLAASYLPCAAYTPPGGTEPTSDPIAIRLCVGDAGDALQVITDGSADSQTMPATMPLADLLAALGRLPQIGDHLIIASGSHAGTWELVGAQPDDAGGCVLSLRRDRHYQASKAGRA